MENSGKRIQLVKTRHDIAVFNICKSADMQDKSLAASFNAKLLTGLLDIPIGEPERFASLPQT